MAQVHALSVCLRQFLLRGHEFLTDVRGGPFRPAAMSFRVAQASLPFSARNFFSPLP
ncbi:hypothetical protein SXIM_41580 [Streptomyces xiamenensis]|uniref:Uncharacterized protein n=1 Tax=Streptomyces xiamenensis TaxID=408015 RepID=A0A0F7FYA1_9ACTN|nr:hypothetical protein SXIM_41580 [Streptomyces xiamenensis]